MMLEKINYNFSLKIFSKTFYIIQPSYHFQWKLTKVRLKKTLEDWKENISFRNVILKQILRENILNKI